MAQSRTGTKGSEIGYANYTTVVFTILRLTGDLDWSWWWILSPTWGIFGLFFVYGMLKGILE